MSIQYHRIDLQWELETNSLSYDRMSEIIGMLQTQGRSSVKIDPVDGTGMMVRSGMSQTYISC